ncbi:MAG: oligosaccharide flippase family protein [Lachnospiraceae bacterium]|nr:oligosaccharide flippase family protein [Lachnospiraceae bacterium]
MTKETKLIKNTAIIAVGNICTKCISFFMLPLYTALLTTEEYGTVDLLTTYSALCVIVLTLQFEQGVFRCLIDARSDEERQKRYISTSVFVVAALNIAVAAVIAIVLSAFKYQYTVYFVCLVLFNVLNGLLIQIPRGLGNNTVYTVASCLNGSINVILNVLFIAVLKLGVNGMLSANILAYIISTIYVVIKVDLPKYVSVKWFDKHELSELVKYSFPLIPNTMCWWIINASDRTVINFFLNTAANGIYAAAYKFPSLFSTISNIFQLAWTESVSENVNDTDRDSYYRTMLDKSIRFYSSCNIGIIAIMPFLFSILINEKFGDAYYYIPILMTAALMHSVAALYGSIYFAFKETKKVADTTVVSAVINLVVNVALIKIIGLYAAAISSLLAYVVVVIIRYVDLNKRIEIKISKAYLIVECLVYVLVFFAYYNRVRVLQVIIFVLLVPYCIFQNREFLLGTLKLVKKKVGK